MVCEEAPSVDPVARESATAPTASTPTPALCYNLRDAPQPQERNPEYAAKLQRVLIKLDFPQDYVASVS